MNATQWQSLLTLGNDCFHDNQWQQAEYFYSEAYDILAYSYRNNPVCEQTMMAWICTCHNLSSLYEQMDNCSLALRFLTVPHNYLKEVAHNTKIPNDIKLIAIKGLSITLPPILKFAKQYPLCDDCMSSFSQMESLIEHSCETVH